MAKTLIDFSQLAISSCVVHAQEIKQEGNPKDLIKHIIINQLLGIKKKTKGEVILCCDSRKYWRRDVFPYYKGHRKHAKDGDFLDWDMIYSIIDETKKEFKEYFPYVVLEVEGAEADDIISALVKYFDENELEGGTLIEEPQTITISSTDKDFKQLLKYRNVKIWHNVDGKFVTCDNPKKFLIEHICGGDPGDNIGNIVTGDWWSIARANDEKTRQKSFHTARLQDFYNKGINACANDEERQNYLRNEKLINLDCIPEAIYNKVIQAYLDYKPSGNKNTIFKYLTEHRMKLLLSDIGSF